MRKLILGALLLLSMVSFSQSVTYQDLQNGSISAYSGTYESYTSKDGSVYKVGDKIQFGLPSGVNGKFVTISKMDIMLNQYPVGSEAVNTSAEIKKIRVGGTKRSGYKIAFQTKGMTGIDNYFMFLEDGISTGEIKSFGMTSDEALIELKKFKDKLDLGLITQEEFDKKKEELIKFIK